MATGNDRRVQESAIGRLSHPRSRGKAALLGLVLLGGAIAGCTPKDQQVRDTGSAIGTPSSVASQPSVAAPAVASTMSASAGPSSASAVPTPPAPVLSMTCPPGGTTASPLFGHDISATAPYTVEIDYGDGHRYTNDDQHLGAVFSHTYHVAGTFTVTAVVIDPTGQMGSASCAYSWAPLAAAPPAPAPGGGSPAPPPGATALCNDGTWSFSRPRQGTCSLHGGVAEWL